MNVIDLYFGDAHNNNKVLVKMRTNSKLKQAFNFVCERNGLSVPNTHIFYNDNQLDINKTPHELNLPNNSSIKYIQY